MIKVNDLKNGVVIEYDGKLMQIIEFMHVLQNKVAYVRVKMKNLRTGAVMETALKGSDSAFKRCFIDKKAMQYIYNSGDTYTFMDLEKYEQIEVPTSHIEWEKNFLVEGQNVEITSYESEILGVNLPDKITLTLVECDPAVKGDTKTNALKDAVVETGLKVKVPLFMENGTRIIISTIDGSYCGREQN